MFYTNKNRLEERKKTRTDKPAVQDPKLLDLQRKLEEKRAERLSAQAQQRSQIKPDRKSAVRLQQLSSAKVSHVPANHPISDQTKGE